MDELEKSRLLALGSMIADGISLMIENEEIDNAEMVTTPIVMVEGQSLVVGKPILFIIARGKFAETLDKLLYDMKKSHE